jgi:hypothetical protein
MQYFLQHPIPLPWFFADVAALLVTLLLVVYLVKRSAHPAVTLLEAFGFVFLYASVFENFAVVNGWYVYGRSFLMVGDVPLAVPLIEVDVLLASLWLLERMAMPVWCRPFVVGLMGMLQDFSLDPVATHQVFTAQGVTSGRWTWLVPAGAANIYGITVYNFPGWMLIMMYFAAYALLGRWWFRRSGHSAVVGYVYPFLATILALATMVSPLSQFLLWLGPLGRKGSIVEWVMLAFWLAFPTVLLVRFWGGRMKARLSLGADLPVFAVPLLFHLLDVAFALTAHYNDVLWLVLLATVVHCGFLAYVYVRGRSAPATAGRVEPVFAG